MRGGRSVEVLSADGTALAAEVLGEGPPLVLVHGAAVDRRDWMELPELLAHEHTVWAYDRRGRGDSADGPSWRLEFEIDDVRAVLAAAGEPAHLLGHSFGGVCAFRAAASGTNVRSLTLYEPPVHVYRAAAAVERAVAQFDAGDPDGGLATFLVDVAGLPRSELDAFRDVPDAWNPTVARAHTVRREIHALAQLPWRPLDFGSVSVPTLHIAGGLTEGPAYPSHDDIAEAVPHASHATIPDQGHVAFASEPEQFAQVVLGFTRQH